MVEGDDAGVLALAVLHGQDLAVGIERVAVEDRLLQADLVHAQLGQGVLGRVLGRQADHQGDADAAEGDPAIEDAAVLAHDVLVEVPFGRVHHQVGDLDVVDRLHRLAAGMAEHRAGPEVLEIVVVAGQFGGLQGRHSIARRQLPNWLSGLPSRLSEMMRRWISEVPSKILVSRASRQ